MLNDIYSYITTEKTSYELPIDLQGWEWNMKEHIKTAFFYKNGRILSGNSDFKPVKNIVRPILNLQYRTEDLDVKDVVIYINSPDKYSLSFLVKKYYEEVFLKKHNLEDFLDESNESRIDYGLALLYDNGTPVPEVIPLENIAFCDQHDILSGPICFSHNYSPDKLKEMEANHWGDPKFGATVTIDELITLCQHEVKNDNSKTADKTPGKYIKVYELHGNLPESFLKENGDPYKYETQTQIVAYYQKSDGKKEGVTLFRGKTKMDKFKVIIRDKIAGRACGFGGVEELAEPQVWVNYSQLKFRQMLDSAAKTIFDTNSPTVANTGRIKDAENMEAVLLEDGEYVKQIDTFPRNISLFEKYIQEWEIHAQKIGAANESLMGETPKAGTPFKLQELITNESRGLHEWRRGKFAKTIEEVYRDWIIPYIEKEVKRDNKFLATLSLDEMEMLADKVINKRVYDQYQNGTIAFDEIEPKKEEMRAEFMKDNKKFLEWKGSDMENVKLAISISIAGKQKNLSLYTDKLVNVFRQIASAPQLLDDPRMAKIFNKILENSGLEPMDFGGLRAPQAPANQTQTAPMAELSNEDTNNY